MKESMPASGTKKNVRVRVMIADTPRILKTIADAIARRAYEIYSDRGAEPGNEREDWRKAESEVLAPLCCGILKLNDGVLIEADTSQLNAKEIELCIEPRRLIIASISPVPENGRDRMTFRVLGLANEVDPETATMKLRGPILEIQLHEPVPVREGNPFPKAA